ncbi:hypothetical protein D9M69_483320 [compost metagenome]
MPGQLLAQPVDQHFDRVGRHVGVEREHLVEQLRLGQRLAAARQQRAQQRRLARRQRQRLAIERKAAGLAVEHQRAALQARVRAAAAAPDQRQQACFQLGDGEGLGQVVVGAEVEAAHAFVERVLRGQDQHRGAVVAPAHRLEHGQPVLAGQAQVEHDRVVFLGLQPCLGLQAVGDVLDHEAALLQCAGDPACQFDFILHQQDAHAGPPSLPDSGGVGAIASLPRAPIIPPPF